MAFSFVFLLTSCSKGSAKNADKTINYNLAAEPGTLDPQVAADTSSVTVIQALFEGLTRLDANDKPVPGLPQSGTLTQTARNSPSRCVPTQNGPIRSP